MNVNITPCTDNDNNNDNVSVLYGYSQMRVHARAGFQMCVHARAGFHVQSSQGAQWRKSSRNKNTGLFSAIAIPSSTHTLLREPSSSKIHNHAHRLMRE